MSKSFPVYSNDYLTLISVPAIKEITIKSKATSIKGVLGGFYAFQDAKDTIETVKFEAGSAMKSISPCCFLSCTKLTLVDFSQCTQIKSIGDEAFKGCSKLESINLPETIESIGNYVFQSSGLRSLHIPAHVKNYGWNVCQYCYSLTEFTIDPKAPFTYLDNHQFTGTKLKSLRLTQFIQSFSGDNFEGVTTIETLEVDPLNSHFQSENNVIYDKDSSNLHIIYAAPKLQSPYTMRNDVKVIGICAFHSSRITEIVFSQTLTFIGSYSFYRSLITSVDIPQSVSHIDAYAFCLCGNLAEVTFHEGKLRNIGTSAFASCDKIKEVVIPSTVEVYGGNAFPVSVNLTVTEGACISVSEGKEFLMNREKTALIQCLKPSAQMTLPSSITVIMANSFNGLKAMHNLEITPETKITDIQAYAFADSSIAEIKLPETVQFIRNYAFLNCKQLTSIHLGNALKSIETQAFMNCLSLETIDATESAQSITLNEQVFSDCVKLTTASFNRRVSSMGKNSFYNCYKLETFEFGANINYIGTGSFQNTGLKSVVFPPSATLENIPTRCFYNCTGLSTFSIPEGVTTIMDEAFAFTAIPSITLPLSVTNLKDFCFKECYSLKTFTIPSGSNLSSIGYGVFFNCRSFEAINNTCDKYEISNEALFKKDMSALYVLPPKATCKFFSFPTQLKTVGAFALQGCHNVEVIFVPSSVNEIMQSAFRDCINLRSINIPKECKTIGPEAFKGCTKIQCGIAIENKADDFRNSLVTIAGLSKTAINECSVMCPSLQRKHINMFPSLLLNCFFLVI